ncbi:MAG: SDR family NAD(P)-dependent oxidoreductase [Chitinophagales bacterium]|nr:SDR family NAD(P)-dependent oxidoreductase [Chitinophagales bacterium]
MPKKVIIIGASSGIGSELAKVFSEKGFEVGITARRLDYLQQLAKQLPGKCYVAQMDVAAYEDARHVLQELIAEMGGVDIVVLNAAIGESKPTWQKEMETVHINAAGFTALANFAYQYFAEKGGGHIVGVSSIAALRGSRMATVYSATKAYISSYMQGLRYHAASKKNGITITDIRPGFVATPMTEKNKGMFWVATSRKAAEQIVSAIQQKRKVAYITKRWAVIALLYKLLPDWVFRRV